MTSPDKKKEKFSVLFEKHYQRLFNYSFKIFEQKDICGELVQETFIVLWKHIDIISPDERSIEAFLIVTLKNKIIDFHRKQQTRQRHTNLYVHNKSFETSIETTWEVQKRIEQVYTALQPKTLEIFKLSREKGLSYREISSIKKISIKTVEAHISKALTSFRKGLKDFM